MTLVPDADLTRWLAGFLGALAIAGLAWRLRSLSGNGMTSATILGTIVVGAAGWWAGVILIAFFVSSSVLSHIGRDHTTVSTSRGSRRDATQVLANGGVALVASIGWASTGHSAWLIAVAGSLAAANADTWSTELGRTSRSLPHLITTGKRVAAGTSGAVSPQGLLGAAGGGLLIGVLTAAGAEASWIALDHSFVTTMLAVTMAGIFGSLFDSLLGATIQEQRWCRTCNTQTEQRTHRCGRETQHQRGVSWITNDVVNGLCVASGALLAAALVI